MSTRVTVELTLDDNGILVVHELGPRDRMLSLRPDGSVRTMEYEANHRTAGVEVARGEHALARALKWFLGGARP